jgi:hypothetical protein
MQLLSSQHLSRRFRIASLPHTAFYPASIITEASARGFDQMHPHRTTVQIQRLALHACMVVEIQLDALLVDGCFKFQHYGAAVLLGPKLCCSVQVPVSYFFLQNVETSLKVGKFLRLVTRLLAKNVVGL